MILAKIAFDVDNQQFRLKDPELAAAFRDGETYLVIVDFVPGDLANDIEALQPQASSFDLTDLREIVPTIGNA